MLATDPVIIIDWGSLPSQLRPPSLTRPSGPTTGVISKALGAYEGINITRPKSDVNSFGAEFATHSQSSFVCEISVPAVPLDQNLYADISIDTWESHLAPT